MAWRSVVINNPARLKLKHNALVVEQNTGTASVPMEDIAVLIIDHPQVTITSQLLSACADYQLAVITVDQAHTPNGILLSYLPHSRALKVMRQQLAMSLPQKKRLWQFIIKQKLLNQAYLLRRHKQKEFADRLEQLASRVKSGDPDNYEAYGAQIYFTALFGRGFTRNNDILANGVLNYGYSIVRSAVARSLVGYGFLSAFGLHHCNEQNAFNLADDLMEPYRPIVDRLALVLCGEKDGEEELDTSTKAKLVAILHQDVPRVEGCVITGQSTLLSLIDATVISLGQCLLNERSDLVLPGMNEISK